MDNGILNAQTTGGTQPYHYYWFHDLTDNSQILTNMHPGYYFVSVVDANGCSDTASAMISQPNELILDEFISNVNCKGGHDGYIIVTPSGGVPQYDITWSNGYFTDSIGNLPVGNYTITVIDDNGCQKIETYNITQPGNYLNTDFIQVSNVSCFGFSDASANVSPTGGTSPYIVFWEDGVYQEGFAGFGMPANIYYNITIVDANGCEYFDSIRFTQPPLLVLNGTTSAVVCGESAGSGTVTPTGGTPPYTFIWPSGETNQSAINLSFGTNYVTVTDSHTCKDSLELYVQKTGKIYGNYEILSPNLCFRDSLLLLKQLLMMVLVH